MNISIVRLKLLMLLIITSVAIVIHNIYMIIGMFLCVMVCSLVIVPRESSNARLKAMGVVAIFVVLFHVLFHTAVPVPVRLFLGSVLALRLITLSFLVFLFTETTSVSEIVTAFSFLPRQLCLMLTISFALLPSIIRETQAISVAQQARGMKTHGALRFRAFFPMIIPLLHRTLSRAEHIAIVLETRGFEV